MMFDVLHYVNWREVAHLSLKDVVLQVRNSCFYYVYFHEQFHHKVESLGFRTLLTTQLIPTEIISHMSMGQHI